MRHRGRVSRKGYELLVSHLRYLVHLTVRISSDELFDDHEPTSNSDDQLAVQNFGINLLSSEEIEPVADLSDRHRAVGLVDVVAQHLIKNIALWHVEHRLLLLVSDLLVHNPNDLVLILDEQLHFLDVIDLLSNVLRQD